MCERPRFSSGLATAGVGRITTGSSPPRQAEHRSKSVHIAQRWLHERAAQSQSSFRCKNGRGTFEKSPGVCHATARIWTYYGDLICVLHNYKCSQMWFGRHAQPASNQGARCGAQVKLQVLVPTQVPIVGPLSLPYSAYGSNTAAVTHNSLVDSCI